MPGEARADPRNSHRGYQRVHLKGSATSPIPSVCVRIPSERRRALDRQTNAGKRKEERGKRKEECGGPAPERREPPPTSKEAPAEKVSEEDEMFRGPGVSGSRSSSVP